MKKFTSKYEYEDDEVIDNLIIRESGEKYGDDGDQDDKNQDDGNQGQENNDDDNKDDNDVRTYSQEELDAMIQDRVGRLKKKYEQRIEKIKGADSRTEGDSDDDQDSDGKDEPKEKTEDVANEIQKLKDELDRMRNTNTVLSLGVKDDYIDDVIVLANNRDGKDFKEKVEQILKEYPIFKGVDGGAKFGKTSSNSDPDEEDIRFNNIAKRMNVKL